MTEMIFFLLGCLVGILAVWWTSIRTGERKWRRASVYPAEWPRNLMKSLSEAGPPVPREDNGSTMIDIGTTEPPDGFVLNHNDDMGPGRYQ